MSVIDVGQAFRERTTTRIVCLTKPEHLEMVPELARRAKVAEFRYDTLGIHNPDQLTTTLQHISRYMGVLFTNRWTGEGGQMPMNESRRREVALLVAPFVSAMDVEIRAPGSSGIALVSRRANKQLAIIASHHDFEGTTVPDDWHQTVRSAQALLPDWVKLGVELDTHRRLGDFSEFMVYASANVIPVGMGHYGVESRREAIRRGRPAVYCTPETNADAAFVPGQLTLDMADKIWHELGITDHPGALAP
jgi:3-dehydroquinate dehydratase type I